jgi:hypothetical protein
LPFLVAMAVLAARIWPAPAPPVSPNQRPDLVTT